MNNMSKADVLINLKSKLKKAFIEDLHVFTVGEWASERAKTLSDLNKKFPRNTVIVRSSSQSEDMEASSRAGCFYSALDIDSRNIERLSEAIEKVIDSYKKKGTMSDSDQVIVQNQTTGIKVSGVVFTRALGTNAPYYVINYDDKSGKTDTVTGGVSSEMVCIFRYASLAKDNRWAKLIETVKEIEPHFSNKPLDIEFAVKETGDVVIFQTRILSANNSVDMPDDGHVKHFIKSMQDKFTRFSHRRPHLSGRRTIFGDMPDWNPAEMLGSRPNTLDYTLYSFLITDHIWHEARSTLGYKDVYPGELMTSFGKRPYIDTRLSFNSFLPKDLPEKLCDKLIDFYIDELERHPEKQDKVEFEVALTCYNFSINRELAKLPGDIFTKDDKEMLKNCLFKLTASIIKDKDIFQRDINLLNELDTRANVILSGTQTADNEPWTLFEAAYNLLQNCKKFGVLPFSRLARLAFIGKNILISLKNEKIITYEEYQKILNSIQTVASGLSHDLEMVRAGKLAKSDFFKSYGHLRPGTYDITAPRYDQINDLFESNSLRDDVFNHSLNPGLTSGIKDSIHEADREHGFDIGATNLLTFICEAIKWREFAKLKFTNAISNALEIIAEAGEKLGFTREDMSQVDLGTLMKFRNPEYSDIEWAKKVVSQSLNRHKEEKKHSDFLVLPPVITSEKDFEIVNFYKARPNFITNKIIQAPALIYDREKFLKARSLNEYIILLENADPGYDWIFTKSPKGIITKYGGVASHMAIRCAEFGIPAAIGCGVTIYDSLSKSGVVRIDCAKQVVEGV